ncbi:mCG144699, partial [Mus musculus]
ASLFDHLHTPFELKNNVFPGPSPCLSHYHLLPGGLTVSFFPSLICSFHFMDHQWHGHQNVQPSCVPGSLPHGSWHTASGLQQNAQLGGWLSQVKQRRHYCSLCRINSYVVNGSCFARAF